MNASVYKQSMHVRQDLVDQARDEWARFPKRIEGSLPKLAKKFLGCRPGQELGDNKFSDTHFQFVLLMALTGQRDALVPLFRGDLLIEEAVKPARSTKMESRRVVNRWCAQRVGLTGWAEVFAVPAGPEPAPEEDIPRVDYYVSSPVSWREPEEVKWWGTPGEPDGLRWRKASSFVPFFRQVLDRLGWLIVARATPWMNAHGWSDEFLDAEIEWCARMVRGRLGLALEQPVLVSDPRVELPPEFSGFVTG